MDPDLVFSVSGMFFKSSSMLFLESPEGKYIFFAK